MIGESVSTFGASQPIGTGNLAILADRLGKIGTLKGSSGHPARVLDDVVVFWD
jgi:hypothetical protein